MLRISVFNSSKPAKWVALSTLVYLFVAWALVYSFDVLNILDMQNRLINAGEPIPLFFWILFTEGGLTEKLQWVFLASGVITCGFLIGQSKKSDKHEINKFFFLLGTGTFLMFLEDTVNTRHIISFLLRSWLDLTTYIIPFSSAIEFFIYFVIGGIMVYPLWKYYTYLKLHRKTRCYLIVGYTAYAVASIASTSRKLFDWYNRVGEAIIHFFAVNETEGWGLAANILEKIGWNPLGFYLIDYLFEESIELIGAGFLLAFFLSYLNDFTANQLHSKS